MATVPLEETQIHLAKVIEQLRPGEEIVITRDQKPVTRLVVLALPEWFPRQRGTMKRTVFHMAPDFDAALEDFKEYME